MLKVTVCPASGAGGDTVKSLNVAVSSEGWPTVPPPGERSSPRIVVWFPATQFIDTVRDVAVDPPTSIVATTASLPLCTPRCT